MGRRATDAHYPHYLAWVLLQIVTAVACFAIAVTAPLPEWLAIAVFIVPFMAVRLYFEDEKRTEPIVRLVRRR